MEVDKKEVGQRIRTIRNSLNLSMEKFGQLIGDLPRSTVNNWERGINLPKKETRERIAEVGHTTDEYLLYGDDENQYILDLLKKKAGATNPAVEQLIIEEIKQEQIADDNQLNRMIDFFVANLIPPSEQDSFTFQLIDEEKSIYLGFTHFRKQAQLYLHYDAETNILHIVSSTFSTFSMDRLLAFLANEESLPCFTKELDTEFLEQPIILYIVSSESNDAKFYPLTYDKSSKAYGFKESNLELLDGQLYLPFVKEVEKNRLLNKEYPEK
ncbi:helix-turn-helix domain-containing protein [Listeria welshimeri]|uniref:helix-turn-helix domain-containing protein n=1 Tax=Listeria welshimeri TaxID=1643 RepID=UPI00188834A2|nr:helix-turn-helix domain-containing protein [Listeria welshimeri]MBF2483838.1 helix-turn-helix domain-containing protein [Listeria welshimeri]